MGDVVSIRAKVKNELVTGSYPLVTADADSFVVQHPKHGRIRLPKAAATSGLPASAGVTLSYEELVAVIKERFAVLDRMTTGVVDRHIRSLIVSGAAGVGKTYSIEKKLKEARREEKVEKYTPNRGTLSPIGLYVLLYQHRHAGDVLLIDDCDAAFETLDTLNILKAALDTGKSRLISYAKEAYALKAEGIPARFEFEGAVIFISNMNFDAMVQSNSKLAPHLKALMDRSLYIDLGLHSTQALLARVENVCRETDMLRDLGLDDSQVEEVIRWIKDNFASLRSLSLRTAMQIAGLIKTSSDWKSDAKVTMLKAQRR